MSRALLILAAAAALYLVWSPPVGRAVAAAGPERVHVTNFPPVQDVRGTVAVREPIPATQLQRRTELVSAGDRLEANSLAEARPLEAAGFTQVVLSLAGMVKGEVRRPGAAGVLLLPDEPEIVRAFLEHGELQFALEVQAPLSPGGSGRFHSGQEVFHLGFPRYRVYFYNAGERALEATLYAYLGS
jgi:hypothetical protein